LNSDRQTIDKIKIIIKINIKVFLKLDIVLYTALYKWAGELHSKK